MVRLRVDLWRIPRASSSSRCGSRPLNYPRGHPEPHTPPEPGLVIRYFGPKRSLIPAEKWLLNCQYALPRIDVRTYSLPLSVGLLALNCLQGPEDKALGHAD